MYGWWAFHPYSAKRSAPGFPDLTLVRDRVIFAELKRDRGGRLSPAQIGVHELLRAAGAEVYVWWFPRDLPEVARVLARRIAPPRAESATEDAAAA